MFLFFSVIAVLYSIWTPGKDFTDGRHDRKRNGIWIQHGWLGNDNWFYKYRKEDKIEYYRNTEQIKNLAALLRSHNITDVFPHLSPTSIDGAIPSLDSDQVAIFLEEFDGLRVMPWVGGVVGKQASPGNPRWRRNFTHSVQKLMSTYPKFSGIHINIEPCPSGNKDFLELLDDVRKVLPEEKTLSVSAFPPSTILHPFNDVHWNKEYYRQVSRRADQLVVMMYDTALRFEKVYQNLNARWTKEVLDWSDGTDVLLGLPAYSDEGIGYHDPKVENLKNALLGVHAGLSTLNALPDHYQGIALYAEWEMDTDEWAILRNYFLRK